MINEDAHIYQWYVNAEPISGVPAQDDAVAKDLWKVTDVRLSMILLVALALAIAAGGYVARLASAGVGTHNDAEAPRPGASPAVQDDGADELELDEP